MGIDTRRLRQRVEAERPVCVVDGAAVILAHYADRWPHETSTPSSSIASWMGVGQKWGLSLTLDYGGNCWLRGWDSNPQPSG